jgi:hypothetical protein
MMDPERRPLQPELSRTTWVKDQLVENLDEPLKASVAYKFAERLRADRVVVRL